MIFPIKRKNNRINDNKSFGYYELLETFKQDGVQFVSCCRKRSSKVCPICIYENTFKEIYASEIARSIKDEKFFNKFKDGSGLCFDHLIAVKKYITDSSDLIKLLEFQESVVKKTIQDLRSLIKKHDYLNKELITITDADARKKTLRKIVGKF